MYMGDIDFPEQCFTLYLPIYMNHNLSIPERFSPFSHLIYLAREDCKTKDYKYIYITVKNLFVEKGGMQNRCGAHVDGFMSDDENYVYVSGQPTEWISTALYKETPDHRASINNFNEYFSTSKILLMESNTLYRLGKTIHRTPVIDYSHVRLFVKISFSNHKYNLEGNAINDGIRYHWKYYKRGMVRNHPTKSNTDSF